MSNNHVRTIANLAQGSFEGTKKQYFSFPFQLDSEQMLKSGSLKIFERLETGL